MLTEIFLIYSGIISVLIFFGFTTDMKVLLVFAGILMLIYGYQIYSTGMSFQTGINGTSNSTSQTTIITQYYNSSP